MRRNKLSARTLHRILRAHRWTEHELAGRAHMARSVVSMHLSGERAIRGNHLNAYLVALDDGRERSAILRAWLQDHGVEIKPGN
jgi:hypothetical protein